MKKLISLVIVALLSTGCASSLTREVVDLGNGISATYVSGKVAGDGQEAVFRDAWVDGRPVVSHFGSGQSLVGQVLQGAASSALIAGGMVGSAAVLRPTRINQTDNSNLNNEQGQLQAQDQDQGQASLNHSESNPVTVQSTDVDVKNSAASSSKSSAKNTNLNLNSNSNKATATGGKAVNTNVNSNKADGGQGGVGGTVNVEVKK